MEKHIPLDGTIKELDDIMSRVNGLEVSSTDEYQRATVSAVSYTHLTLPTNREE